MASDEIETRDGVAGRVRFVWAVWSPCDDCWAYVVSWPRSEAWKADALTRRLSKFWPFPMAVVEVFEPLTDRNDDAIAAALSALPPSPVRLSPEEVAGFKAAHDDAVRYSGSAA